MSCENDVTVSTERLLGAELVRAAEGLLAGMRSDGRDAAPDARVATMQVLLGLYWELRHQDRLWSVAMPAVLEGAGSPEVGTDASIEWLSAVFCSVRPRSMGASGVGWPACEPSSCEPEHTAETDCGCDPGAARA